MHNFLILFFKPGIQALSDEELISSYRKENDNRFLSELFGRYIRSVFLISMKYLKDEELSKDISMQVFEKLVDDLKRFEVKHFKSWLHVVTKNACYMHHRSNKVLEKVSLPESMENDALLHHEYDHGHELRLEQLEKAITMLDMEQKQCIELFYLQDKTYKEVADITGFSMNEVKSHIQNGKRNLKNYLVVHGDTLLMVFACVYFLNK